MKPKFRTFDEVLKEYLQDPEFAFSFLNNSFDSKRGNMNEENMIENMVNDINIFTDSMLEDCFDKINEFIYLKYDINSRQCQEQVKIIFNVMTCQFFLFTCEVLSRQDKDFMKHVKELHETCDKYVKLQKESDKI